MTHHPDAPSGQPYSPPPWDHLPPPSPAPGGGDGGGGKKRNWFARHKILTIIGGVFLLIVIAGVAAGNSADPKPAVQKPITAPSMPPLPSEQRAADTSAAEEPTPPPVTPTAKDFKLSIKVLSKECLGDAGCNVEYRVNLKYVGTATLPDDSSYEVTYAVHGDESGPQTDTITTHGMEYEQPYENMASTPSSATKLTVKVTGVEDVS
jgi:hypothetical protein